MKKSLFLILFLIPSFAFSNLKTAMINDFTRIEEIFQNYYAPKAWKEEYNGWNLISEADKAKNEIDLVTQANPKEYHKIVKNFLKSTLDFHVTPKFSSMEYSSLPFHLTSAEGKYYVTYVAKSLSYVCYNAPEFGDEIISIDNRPIAELLSEFAAEEFGISDSKTTQKFAEYFFSKRLGALGMEVPKGTIKLEYLPKYSSKTVTIDVPWIHVPEKINYEMPWKSQAKGIFKLKNKPEVKKVKSLFPLSESHALDIVMISPHYLVDQEFSVDGPSKFLGSLKSDLPPIGTIIEKLPKNPYFDGYVFEGPYHSIVGFLRIPTFSPAGDEDEAIEVFQQIISTYENVTDALVIDLRNNPGGLLDYMYTLLSYLAISPLQVPTQRMINTQGEIKDYYEILEKLNEVNNINDLKEILDEKFCGEEVTFDTKKKLSSYFKDSIDSWNNGEKMTPPLYIYGIDKIFPNKKVSYSKPIILLINELDISCGDFFPAILQDNKRAILFGERTAGAGGAVKTIEYPNMLGIKSISYTRTIAERVDLSKIESIGIIPDIQYSLTKDDILDDFSPYVSEVQKVLESL